MSGEACNPKRPNIALLGLLKALEHEVAVAESADAGEIHLILVKDPLEAAEGLFIGPLLKRDEAHGLLVPKALLVLHEAHHSFCQGTEGLLGKRFCELQEYLIFLFSVKPQVSKARCPLDPISEFSLSRTGSSLVCRGRDP